LPLRLDAPIDLPLPLPKIALLNHGKTSTQIYLAKSAPQASLAHYTLPFLLMGTLARSTLKFLKSKKHYIFGYKRFISYLGRHPKKLRSDQGTEILNKEFTAYLESNHTHHVVCSKDEHASIGVAENSIVVLRTSAKAMMLAGNIPKRLWRFVISHAAYLNNIVSSSRCDRTKTIFEVLFQRRADVRRIPPIGAFCAVYTDRRQLQSFGLTSKQGVFISIARHHKVLGYVKRESVVYWYSI
jgi:hypothetical protein